MYSVIPFGIIFIFNLLLIYKTLKRKINPSNTVSPSTIKKKAMTRTVMIITLGFIVFTLPSAVIGSYFVNDLYYTLYGRVIIFICEAISFSYHSYNFFLYYAFNKQFREECRSMIGRFFETNTNPTRLTLSVTTNSQT